MRTERKRAKHINDGAKSGHSTHLAEWVETILEYNRDLDGYSHFRLDPKYMVHVLTTEVSKYHQTIVDSFISNKVVAQATVRKGMSEAELKGEALKTTNLQ